MSLEDIPSYFADAVGINVTTAESILSIIIIIAILFPYLVLARKNPSPTISLILVFLGECVILGLGWMPFWIMIMTICATALSIAWLGGKLGGD